MSPFLFVINTTKKRRHDLMATKKDGYLKIENIYELCYLIDLDITAGDILKKKTHSTKYEDTWFSPVKAVKNKITSKRVKAYREIADLIIKIDFSKDKKRKRGFKKCLYFVPFSNIDLVEERLQEVRKEYFEVVNTQLLAERDNINRDIRYHLQREGIKQESWHFLPSVDELRDKFEFSWDYSQKIYPDETVISPQARQFVMERAEAEAEKISKEVNINLRAQLRTHFLHTLELIKDGKNLSKASSGKFERIVDAIACINICEDADINRFISEAKDVMDNATALNSTLRALIGEINEQLTSICTDEETIFDADPTETTTNKKATVDIQINEESIF